jgi:sacsin
MNIGESFGQKEKLVNRINDILNRYSTNICVFKELIQNADDSGASQIAFILDSRRLSKSNTFGDGFAKLQGPALLCWNNSVFSENDLNGITNLGEGSKQKDVSKIGRFGVGFNSVYHLTDAPQFISNYQDYVIRSIVCAFSRIKFHKSGPNHSQRQK